MPKAIAPDRLEINGRSYAEWLATCRMVVSPEDPTPTVAGILTLCKHAQQFLPGARIQFLRIDGSSWGDDVIDEQRMDGTIQKQLEMLDQKLMSHNRVAVDIVSAPKEIRRYQYPLSALQQLTRNALMHRSYEGTHSPVMVYWFNDRIEIINAGSPFGRVTPENFGQPGFADYRNPTLAETMKTLGFVQRFGVGIQMAQKDLKENGNPPAEFTFDMTTVICILRQPPTDRSIAVSKESALALQPGAELDQVGTKSGPSRDQVKILRSCLIEKAIGDLMEVAGRTNRTKFRDQVLKPLMGAGWLEMTIPDKPTSSKQKYRLTEKGKQILERE